MRRRILVTVLALPALLFAAPLAAQLARLTSNAKARAALDLRRAGKAWTGQQQLELTQIPSPPFKESRRGAEFKRRIEALAFAGHLDTVFPEGTDVTVKRDGIRRPPNGYLRPQWAALLVAALAGVRR